MKIPLFAWDELDQTYKPFPHELIETFDDGTQGITLPALIECTDPLGLFPQSHCAARRQQYEVRLDILKRHSRSFVLTPLSKLFDPDLASQRYIYKHQKRQCQHRPEYWTPWPKWTNHAIGVLIGGVTAAIVLTLSWLFGATR